MTFIILFLIGLIGIFLVIFNLSFRHKVKTVMDSVSGTVLKTQKGIPILSYHAVDPDCSWGIKRYFVSPVEFEKQVKYLKENGYTSLSFNELENFKSYDKPVIITFDDGYEDVYKYAYPILKKYNMRATIFIISDFVGEKYYLTSSEIIKMSDVFDIQSHTKTHPALSKTSIDSINFEMAQSKLEISNLVNKQVNIVSYPYSSIDLKVINEAAKYYSYGILNWGGKYYGFEGKYRIPRISIYWDDSLPEFIEKIS